MNAETMNEIFNGLAGLAVSPLLTLTVGVMLLLLAEVVTSLARLRPALFVGSILGAAWCEALIFAKEPGLGESSPVDG